MDIGQASETGVDSVGDLVGPNDLFDDGSGFVYEFAGGTGELDFGGADGDVSDLPKG